MRKTWVWAAGFAALYAAHAFFRLGESGRIATGLSGEALRAGAIGSFIALLLLVCLHVATRDEVKRRLALYAAAAAALAIGALSYGAAALAAAPPLLAANLWAVGVLVFLIVYGVLAWRAGS